MSRHAGFRKRKYRLEESEMRGCDPTASRMRFYKYQKPGNLEFGMLRRAEVFFASHAELNDAHECRPRFVLRGTLELWSRLAHLILLETCLRPEYGSPPTGERIQELLSLVDPLGRLLKRRVGRRDVGIEHLNVLFSAALREILSDSVIDEVERCLLLSLSKVVIDRTIPAFLHEPAYIASFSRNSCNPTMWGHYAGAERGFAIVYESSDGKLGIQSPIPIIHGVRPAREGSLACGEIGIYRDDRLELVPVSYRTRPPKANAFHRLIPKFSYSEMEDHYDVPLLLRGDAQEKQERLVGLIKYSDWRYEKEVRAFLPAYGELPPDARVLRVSPEDVAGLIFGPRMSDRDKVRAIACCHVMRKALDRDSAHALPGFAFLQAMQSLDRFALDVHPVGILDGMLHDCLLPLKKEAELDAPAKEHLHRLCRAVVNDGNPGATNGTKTE